MNPSNTKDYYYLDYKKLQASGNDAIFEGISSLYREYLEHLNRSRVVEEELRNHHHGMAMMVLSSLLSSGFMTQSSQKMEPKLING